MQTSRRIITILIVLALIATAFVGIQIPVVAMSGSGTKKDPYLVKTVDDLNAMRKNLSANYKLVATIDLNNREFEPIGRWATPFTGSFTCDLGSDGLPLYAIKNLKVYDDSGIKYKHCWMSANGYVDAMNKADGKYGYDNGLFGTIENANLTNIYVLSANIIGSAVGQNDGLWVDGVKTPYPWQNQMGTAILAGVAKNSVIIGCAATGTVLSNTNCTGGFIGWAMGCTISNSYVDATVKSDGVWSNGGFIGKISDGSIIRFCYSAGAMKAWGGGYSGVVPGTYVDPDTGGINTWTMNYNGAFIGTMRQGCTVSDCYSSMNCLSGHNGNNFIMYAKETSPEHLTIKNVFSYGALEGNTKTPSGKGVSSFTNAFISNETSGSAKDFNGNPILTAASAKKIKNTFSSLDDWDVSGDYPTIKAIPVLSSEDIYVAGKEREGVTKVPSDSSSSSVNSTTSSTTNATTSATTNDTTSDTTSGTINDTISGTTMNTTDESSDVENSNNDTDYVYDDKGSANLSNNANAVTIGNNGTDLQTRIIIIALSVVIVMVLAMTVVMLALTKSALFIDNAVDSDSQIDMDDEEAFADE